MPTNDPRPVTRSTSHSALSRSSDPLTEMLKNASDVERKLLSPSTPPAPDRFMIVLFDPLARH
jgi:hypothetical protein